MYKIDPSVLRFIKVDEWLEFLGKGVKGTKSKNIYSEISLSAIAHVFIDKMMIHYVSIR